MYDIPELERKWKIYKRRKIKKPLIILGVSAITLSALSFIAYTYLGYGKKVIATPIEVSTNTTKVAVASSKTINPVIKEEKKIIIKTTPINMTESTANKIEEPKNIMPQNIIINKADEEKAIIDLSNATVAKLNVPEAEVRIIEFNSDNSNNEQTKQYEDILLPKKQSKDIKEKERIKEVEERFRATQNPKDSLWLSRYYYKKGDYERAENWAINTNNIDGEIEESWIIFAKARAKQGRRVDAIKVLQSYYDETGSMKAKKLLDKLRRGKPFK